LHQQALHRHAHHRHARPRLLAAADLGAAEITDFGCLSLAPKKEAVRLIILKENPLTLKHLSRTALSCDNFLRMARLCIPWENPLTREKLNRTALSYDSAIISTRRAKCLVENFKNSCRFRHITGID
jgi:hypothetical protein